MNGITGRKNRFSFDYPADILRLAICLPAAQMPVPSQPSIPIHTIRGERVVLDSDLAAIYGVTTGRFNEAINRNLRRFPQNFSFGLTREEFDNLRSKFATSSMEARSAAPTLISQIAISKPGRGGRRKLPRVFTEHGALVAASLLNSARAIAMSVYVIRAFVEMRERLLTNAEILKQLAKMDRTLLTHDLALPDIYDKLQPLLNPPPDPPRRRIGFQTG